MGRTEIGISSFLYGDDLFLLRYGVDHPDARRNYPLECRPTDPLIGALTGATLSADAVRKAGERLMQALLKHPAVAAAVQALPANHGTVTPLRIHIDADTSEALPWEALFDSQKNFLALDRRWPIVRLADSVNNEAGDIRRSYVPPVKILAVLAAAGVDAQDEWTALYSSITAAPIPTEVRVLVCQDSLLQDINALGAPNISASFLNRDVSRSIEDFAPNILHFFCHGSVDGGPHLQLATRLDWDTNAPRGSIAFDKDWLQEPAGLDQHLWLITLNCCLGAAPTDTYSLARSMVKEVAPAVVGMRTAVRVSDANLFCESFYGSLLDGLDALIASGADEVEVDWSQYLHAPRRQFVVKYGNGKVMHAAASDFQEWTYPVLYMRPERFLLSTAAVNPALSVADVRGLQAEIQELQAAHDQLQGVRGVPQAALNEITQRINALKAELYG